MNNSPSTHPQESPQYQKAFDKMCERLPRAVLKSQVLFMANMFHYQGDISRLTHPINDKEAKIGQEKTASYRARTPDDFFSYMQAKFDAINKDEEDFQSAAPNDLSESLDPSAPFEVSASTESMGNDLEDEDDEEASFMESLKGFMNKRKREMAEDTTKLEAFKTYITGLIAAGIVEEKTAVYFLNHCFIDGFQPSQFYLALTVSAEQELVNQKGIADLVRSRTKVLFNALALRSDVTEMGGAFLVGDPECGEKADYELHINFKRSNNFPMAIITELERLMAASELTNVFFRVSGGRESRCDGIILYFSLPDAEKVAKVLDLFLLEDSNRKLIMPDSMSTGVEIVPGIALVSEIPLKPLLNAASFSDTADLFTQMNTTYSKVVKPNIMYSSFLAMSFAAARNESMVELGTPFDPQEHQERAAAYFKQFLLLAQINPDTMMPMTVNNGQMPAGLQAVISRYNPN